MARKRGGLAGIWDRNKKIIKPIATGLAGLVGTPALAAAVGAAMGGLDREGKGGIGFDVKGGLKGGVAGYGMGSIGNAAGNMLAKRGMDLGMNNALSSLNKTAGKGMKGKLADLLMGKNTALGAAGLPASVPKAPAVPGAADPSLAVTAPPAPTFDRMAMQIGESSAYQPAPAIAPLPVQGGVTMPSAGNLAASLPRQVPASTLGGLGHLPKESLGKRLMGGLEWAEKHPHVLKAGEGLMKGMMPPSGLEQAKTAEAEASTARLNQQTQLEEEERKRMLANQERQRALAAQLRALLAGAQPPAMATYGR